MFINTTGAQVILIVFPVSPHLLFIKSNTQVLLLPGYSGRLDPCGHIYPDLLCPLSSAFSSRATQRLKLNFDFASFLFCFVTYIRAGCQLPSSACRGGFVAICMAGQIQGNLSPRGTLVEVCFYFKMASLQSFRDKGFIPTYIEGVLLDKWWFHMNPEESPSCGDQAPSFESPLFGISWGGTARVQSNWWPSPPEAMWMTILGSEDYLTML